jgi:anti-sigma B factor antagonist
LPGAAIRLHWKLPMSLDIRETSQEGIAVLTLKGRLTVGEAGELREKVTQCAASGKNKIVLDLSQLDYIDSTGLGALVICYTTLKKQDGGVKLVNLNKRNIELLLLTKLHTVFEVFNEVQDAVNSFIPGREIRRFDILSFVQEHQAEES